mgnify:CR=1 FL=1
MFRHLTMLAQMALRQDSAGCVEFAQAGRLDATGLRSGIAVPVLAETSTVGALNSGGHGTGANGSPEQAIPEPPVAHMGFSRGE